MYVVVCGVRCRARFNKRSADLAADLVRLGSDVNLRDVNHRVALMHAVVRGSDDAVRRKRVELLLRLGADPLIRDAQGKRALDLLGCTTDDGVVWYEALPGCRKEVEKCRQMLQVRRGRRSAAMFNWYCRNELRLLTCMVVLFCCVQAEMDRRTVRLLLLLVRRSLFGAEWTKGASDAQKPAVGQQARCRRTTLSTRHKSSSASSETSGSSASLDGRAGKCLQVSPDTVAGRLVCMADKAIFRHIMEYF